jgi:acyl dehydratase
MANKIVPKEELVNFIGTKVESSDWYEVTQDRINEFAHCTGDNYFMHVDPEKAKQTDLGGTIAHGLLTLSLIPYLMKNFPVPENMPHGLNYGFDKVRFLAPVRSGKRVRIHGEVLDVNWKQENHCVFKTGVTVEIEGEEKPALYAEWILYYITED